MEEDRGHEAVTESGGGVCDFRLWGVSLNIRRLIAGMVSGALTGFFALAGAFMGTLSGALAGQGSDTGILKGAVMGAIAGAVLAIEVLEAYRSFWRSDQSSYRNTSLRDFIDELFHDRLVPQQFSSARLMTYHWQLSVSGHGLDEVHDIPGDVASKGLKGDLLKKLPSHVMPYNRKDDHEESICCTICLQDIVGGEIVRRLPLCFHTFHLSCVDKWLVYHSSCPVCRQDA